MRRELRQGERQLARCPERLEAFRQVDPERQERAHLEPVRQVGWARPVVRRVDPARDSSERLRVVHLPVVAAALVVRDAAAEVGQMQPRR
ncbi:MAG: hypothetical protein DME57_10935 [Verrucomicrobia bacterium]|nr:MAG: hypothetical protein DME57_10935 [Verrucomicrobiota bacterium]